MNRPQLANAIRDRARGLITRPVTVGQLADESELLRALAHIVDGVDIEAAFGCPGDWGYSHPIGKAIAAPPEKKGGC